jgi:hypothetical protein
MCGTEPTEIRYATSSDGRSWTTTKLPPPTGHWEQEPQLAFSGNTLYLAYSRLALEDGDCGGDGLRDVGVYVRTKALPSGDWSEPTRIGQPGDRLGSFRVTGSTMHATVMNGEDFFYEFVTGGAGSRIKLPNALGVAALRIGDDGVPRVAYEREDGIAYGTVDGTTVNVKLVPGSDRGWNPTFALAPGNDAYLVWTESNHGGGCAEPEPPPTDGTYVGTNAGGTWVSSRLTRRLGTTSLTVDPSSGELHVLVSDYQRLVWFHRAAGGNWASETLVPENATSAVIRQDPTSGRFVGAYVVESGQDRDERHVEVVTR